MLFVALASIIPSAADGARAVYVGVLMLKTFTG
jgi:hypothetical protein